MIAPAEAAESGLGVHKRSENTASSMHIVVQDVAQECYGADCLVAAANRGLGNSGLRLIGAKEYEGYFFARREPYSGDGGPNYSRQSAARLIVRLEDYTAAGGVAVGGVDGAAIAALFFGPCAYGVVVLACRRLRFVRW